MLVVVVIMIIQDDHYGYSVDVRNHVEKEANIFKMKFNFFIRLVLDAYDMISYINHGQIGNKLWEKKIIINGPPL